MFSIKHFFRLNPVVFHKTVSKTNLHRTVLFSRKSKTCFVALNRNFSISNVLNGKIFTDNENLYAYNVMKEDLKNYKFSDSALFDENVLPRENLNAMLSEDWSQKNCEELLKSFNALSNLAQKENLDISHTTFDNYIDALTDKFHEMTEDQLKLICVDLKKWPETESANTRNFAEIWVALDDVFKVRFSTWDVDKLLTIMDYIYILNLSGKMQSVQKFISRICGKSRELTPEQLVQTMFYISTSRKAPEKMMNLEKKLDELIDKLSIDELSIVCLGFFKSKTTVKDKRLINKILQRTINEVKVINEITLCSILKLVRLSSNRGQSVNLSILLDEIVPKIDTLSMPACVQIAIVTSPMKYFHRESLNAIAAKFKKDPSIARLKDLERLAFAFSHFNIEDVAFYKTIANELRKPEREMEIIKYGRCFFVCVGYLVKANLLPYDLISQCMDEKALKRVYRTLPYYLPRVENEYGRELFLLDGTAEVECEGYEGNRLDKTVVKLLAKNFTEYVPSDNTIFRLNSMQRIMLDVMLTLEKIRGGKQYVTGQHILPHFQKPDVIVADDINGNPVKVQDYFLPNQFYTIQKLPDSNMVWYAIVILKNNDLTCNTNELVGHVTMKLRQLDKLGYVPKLVYWQTWVRLKSEDKRINYLDSIITNSELNIETLNLSKN